MKTIADILYEFMDRDQRLLVLEIAYQALNDPECYQKIAEVLDLADSELMPLLAILKAKLEKR